MRLFLAFVVAVWGASVSAQTITAPLPANCTATMVQSGANFTVSCGGTPPIPPIPPGPVTCSGYQRTITIDLNWAAPKRVYTRDFGGFFAHDALVLRFTTGSKISPGNIGSITGVEYQAGAQQRHATLSGQACDFGNGIFPPMSLSVSSSPGLYFSVGGAPVFGIYPVLLPNTTYYVNLYNTSPVGCDVCNMDFDLAKPQGT